MKPLFIKLSLLVLVLHSYSCSKEKTKYFETIIINRTDYRLNNITLSCSVDELNKQVDSMSQTASFTVIYKEKKVFLGFLGDGPMICSRVSSYSDTLSTYENSIGHTYPLNALKEGQLNYIKIDLDPSPDPPSDKFIITVN